MTQSFSLKQMTNLSIQLYKLSLSIVNFGVASKFGKSELFLNPNFLGSSKEYLSQQLGVKLVDEPGKYLGIIFKLRGRRINGFQDIVEKVAQKNFRVGK